MSPTLQHIGRTRGCNAICSLTKTADYLCVPKCMLSLLTRRVAEELRNTCWRDTQSTDVNGRLKSPLPSSRVHLHLTSFDKPYPEALQQQNMPETKHIKITSIKSQTLFPVVEERAQM